MLATDTQNIASSAIFVECSQKLKQQLKCRQFQMIALILNYCHLWDLIGSVYFLQKSDSVACKNGSWNATDTLLFLCDKSLKRLPWFFADSTVPWGFIAMLVPLFVVSDVTFEQQYLLFFAVSIDIITVLTKV